MNQPNPFKWRHYEAEIILLCVRWYLRYFRLTDKFAEQAYYCDLMVREKHVFEIEM